MQPMEKNVEKQLVVRTFEPDMNALKQTAKQLAHMQDTSLNLYGQAGEVLIVVTARAYAQAAATELTENVAEQFELALGPAAYGRGKGSLAYFTAGELIQSESTIAAADPATGALLAEEFSHTKRGPSVFDFGDGSYNDSRVVAKIKNAVYKYAEEGNAPQIAAARAAAAARFAHADFGVASVGMGTGAEVVYLAVAHRGYVYIKRIKNGEGAGKVVALSALDMVRRLAQKQPVDRARMFKANSDFDWNAPLKKRRSSKYAAPIAVLAVLLVALAVACWYFFTHFSLGGGNGAGGALPVSGSTSISTSASSGEPASVPGTDASVSQPAGDGGSGTPDAGGASSTPQSSGNTGVVHPFGGWQKSACGALERRMARAGKSTWKVAHGSHAARGQANIPKPCRRPRKNRACQQAESRLPHTTETAWRRAFYRLAGKRLRACQHIVISRLFRRVPTRRQQRL